MSRSSPWRLAFAGLVGAIAAAGAACGSFSENSTDSPAGDDAGSDRSVTPVDPADAAPATPCDPAKVDADPQHCGACNHPCLGGACAAGKCQPFEIGRSIGDYVVDVAVDAQRVLWTTQTSLWSGPGHLYACPKSGCPAGGPTSLAAPSDAIGGLAGDGITAYASFVYGSRRIVKIEADGTLARLSATSHASAVRLQMRKGILYYAGLYETSMTGGYAGSVYAWNGTTEQTLASFDGPHNLNDLAVGGTQQPFLSSYFVIETCKSGTCAPFHMNNPGVQAMAADDSKLYWASDSGELLSCAIEGPCPPAATVLGPAQLGAAKPVQVKVDHGRLFVTTNADDIFACDPASCATTLRKIAHETHLYAGGGEAFNGESVTSDDQAVYWAAVDGTPTPVDGGVDTSSLTHRIMKLAK
jgi:hypothetical protein